MLAILERYPQLSETYIATELRALSPRHDVTIAALHPADVPEARPEPFELVRGRHRDARLVALAHRARAQVIHTHYLHMAPIAHRIAEEVGVRYTVRSHSYDVLRASPDDLATWRDLLDDDRCAGVLAFPFLVPRLVDAGITAGKVHACFPVVDFARFHDRSPNGSAVMNVGAALPKKAMADYLELAATLPALEFSLYAVGYDVAELHRRNEELGRPVSISMVQHEDMPHEYKRHRWLLYTASRSAGTIGWPMAVAEAQAAGVGVCIEGIRPDLRDYVGAGGFVVDRLSDAVDLISGPVPAAVRDAGFEQARCSDVRAHIGVLERLWA